jgi:hypothetical protein
VDSSIFLAHSSLHKISSGYLYRQVKHLLDAPLKGRLLALLKNIRLGWKVVTYGGKKFYNIGHSFRNLFLNFSRAGERTCNLYVFRLFSLAVPLSYSCSCLVNLIGTRKYERQQFSFLLHFYPCTMRRLYSNPPPPNLLSSALPIAPPPLAMIKTLFWWKCSKRIFFSLLSRSCQRILKWDYDRWDGATAFRRTTWNTE